MNFYATIKWLDNNNTQEVVVTTDELKEEDDNIFYYFEDEKEIEKFKEEGSHEFIILDYSSM